jgi:hypothetical protein
LVNILLAQRVGEAALCSARTDGSFRKGKAGTSVQSRRGVMTRRIAGVAICAATAGLLSGCSSGNYPAVLAEPAPRADTPLSPDQVKQATDDLISQRDRLSAEAQSSGDPTAAVGAAPATAAAAKNAAASQPTRTAGADPKP